MFARPLSVLAVIALLGFPGCKRAKATTTAKAIDTTLGATVEPTARAAFTLSVSGQEVTVTPEADYEASGYLLSLNRPGGVDLTPGTAVLVWGPGAEALLDPKSQPGDVHPDQGMLGVVAVTDDPNLQRAVASLEHGSPVRLSGWRASVSQGPRIVLPAQQELNGVHVDVVFLKELQAGKKLYAPATLPAE